MRSSGGSPMLTDWRANANASRSLRLVESDAAETHGLSD
jgi:hypothetical protein